MRRILPLILVLAALPTPLRAADGDADDKAIRELTQRFFDAFASKDLDAFMAVWSKKSPGYDPARQFMTGLFADTGPIAVKSLTVVRVRRAGDAARVRVWVELAGNDAGTGRPHPALGRYDTTLDLAREGGGWKVVQSGGTDVRLMDLLVAAPTKVERLRLLDDDSDLVGPDFVTLVLKQSDARAQRGEFEGAARLQDVALEIAEGLGDQRTLANCWFSRGMSLAAQQQDEPALECYQKALCLFREAKDRQQETSRFPDALQSFLDSFNIDRHLSDRAREANILNSIGAVYISMGRYTEALQQYQDSLSIARQLGDHVEEARILNDVGTVYESTGRYAEALHWYQDSLTIARQLGDRLGEARTLGNVGVVYEATGRYGEALQQYQDSLTIARDQGDRAAEASALINTGIVCEDTGRYAEALQQYQASLKITRELHDRAREEATLNNIGVVYEKTGRYPEALAQYQHALQIVRDLGDRQGEAIALDNLGAVYRKTDQYDEALQNLEDGLRGARKIDDLDTAASCCLELGRMYQKRKRWDDAAEAYGEAVQFTEQLRANTREPLLQSSLFAQKTEPFFRRAECLLELRQPSEAFAVGERMKARGLVDILQQGKADLRRGMSNDERKQEQRLQERLTALNMRLEDPRGKADGHRREALKQDRDRVRQDLEDFRRALYLHRPDLQVRRAEFAPASLKDLRSSLFAGRPGLVVLSYLVGDDETLLFVLRPGERAGDARLTVHRIDVGARDLADAVEAFREACSDAAKGEPDSDDLYRWLIAPAAEELAAAKQVVIVPDGVLHTLPFQALRDPDDKYLIERFSVSYAPSVTALVKMEELGAKRRKEYASQPPSLLAVGISDFGRREKVLPAAEPEARAVAGPFGEQGQLLLGTEATYAKVGASWGSCRCLHFATHGRLNSDAPLYSALVLSPDRDEGVLYARDLLDADIPAELVVMSACHTGEGRQVAGEGLLGMSWSWFAAGVPSVVASQWSVGDASTAQLMKVFYARLKAGDSKAEALRQAEWTLLKDPATRHPFYWAPFVLIGDER